MHVVDGGVTPEFARMMVELAAAYPTTGKLTEATIRVYANMLAEHSVDEIRSAVGRAARAGGLGVFFPSAPELLRMLRSSADDAGLIAWALFRRAAEDVGAYASVEVEDVAAADALALVFGSWPEYCTVEDGPALTQRRAEFLAVYRDGRRRATSGPARRLAGLCEMDSSYRGGPGVIVGRLTAAGTVLTGPDVPKVRALPPGLDVEP